MTRATLSNLINGRAGISPEMGIRLAKAFGGSPETWLKLQMKYDLAEALENGAQWMALNSSLLDGLLSMDHCLRHKGHSYGRRES